jgi:hypothetical protein
MGGLIGIGVAGFCDIIERMVLVDIGPFVSGVGLLRIKNYVGKDERFASFADGEKVLREVMKVRLFFLLYYFTNILLK